MATRPKLAAHPLPSVEKLRERFRYNSATGAFTYACDVGRKYKAGDPAGSVCLKKCGYRTVAVIMEGRRMLVHRIAWKVHHGVEPPDVIDHRNGDATDNRIDNLREASTLSNQHNKSISKVNRSGCSGVYFSSEKQKYRAQIRAEGRRVHLGFFVTIEDATAARRAAEHKYFGAFAASNREVAHHGN